MPTSLMVRDEIGSHFATFRPSDREAIERHFVNKEGEDIVFDSITRFIEVWESAGWVEDYSIERIGKWFGLTARQEFCRRLDQWGKLRRTKARVALRNGLKIGFKLRNSEKALNVG